MNIWIVTEAYDHVIIGVCEHEKYAYKIACEEMLYQHRFDSHIPDEIKIDFDNKEYKNCYKNIKHWSMYKIPYVQQHIIIKENE